MIILMLARTAQEKKPSYPPHGPGKCPNLAHPRIGIIFGCRHPVYFKKSMNARKYNELDSFNFVESVWATFNSHNKERVLIGCMPKLRITTNRNRSRHCRQPRQIKPDRRRPPRLLKSLRQSRSFHSAFKNVRHGY